MNKKEIQDKILRKLMALEKWGGAHTELINLFKGLPKHLRGEKITHESVEELYKMNFLLAKKSTGEIHVSLNTERKKEILAFLGLQN